MPSYAETLGSWHDFFVTAGAASATLAGLLFVGISLHVRVVATHVDVRSLARVTLSAFFTVLVISLVMLYPTDEPVITGLALLAATLASLVLIIPAIFGAALTDRQRALPRRVILSRFGAVLVTYLGLAAVALMFQRSDSEGAFGLLFGVVVVMLVVAVRNSWDLLVTLAAK